MPTHHVRDHYLAPGHAVEALYAGRYGRLFPDLPPLATEGGFLRMLGRQGGACDGGLAADAGDDAREAAGWPIFGQFVAHDITADRSPVTHHAEAEQIRNFRTPRVNLECVCALEFFQAKFGLMMMARQLTETAGNWPELRAKLVDLYERDEPLEYLVTIGRKEER